MMERVFNEGKKYENLIFRDNTLCSGDYENCTFAYCDFSDSDLSENNFLECEFRECNFSLAKLTQTSFREVKFMNCKLLGLHFEDCNNMMISFEFDGCAMDFSSFNGLTLKGTIFKNSRLIEADFTDADLKYSIFINCDLLRTIFKNTSLEGADFRTSFNYSIDPGSNRIKKAKFSLPGITGLLDRYDIDIEK